VADAALILTMTLAAAAAETMTLALVIFLLDGLLSQKIEIRASDKRRTQESQAARPPNEGWQYETRELLRK
jgi:hypothetical protein